MLGNAGIPVHILPPATAGTLTARRRATAAATPDPSNNLYCHGGNIQAAQKNYLIFWGNWTAAGDPAGAQSYAIQFMQDMGGSRWENVDSIYYNPLKQHVGASSYGRALTDTTMPPAAPLQSDLAAEAASAAAVIGDYSPNASYIIMLPKGIVPSGFGSQFCAWHSYANANGTTIAYTNMPYVSDPSKPCGAGAAGGINDGIGIVLGHEQAETQTDPFLNGWYDVNGNENGDKCAWQFIAPNGNLAHHQATQPLWSNTSFDANNGSQCLQSY